MELVGTENWVYLHLALIFGLSAAQLAVVYALSNSDTDADGIGLFGVYLVSSLLVWVAFTVRQASNAELSIDVTAVGTLITTYILLLAVGQRTRFAHGRYAAALITSGAALADFALPDRQALLVHTIATAALYAGIGALALRDYLARRNAGDTLIASASGLMLVLSLVAQWQLFTGSDRDQIQNLLFAGHALAFGVIAAGFIASILLDYRDQLSQLAVRDPLTGLPNLRGLDEALRLTLANAARREHDTTVVLVDIDHFREVNETFGLAAGDAVLRSLARTLEDECRGSDMLARIGIEQFLLVLPETGLPGSRVLAERVRAAISAEPLHIGENSIPITVSLGIAGTRGAVDLGQLIESARRALKLAKQGGRNRVASVDPSPVTVTAPTLSNSA